MLVFAEGRELWRRKPTMRRLSWNAIYTTGGGGMFLPRASSTMARGSCAVLVGRRVVGPLPRTSWVVLVRDVITTLTLSRLLPLTMLRRPLFWLITLRRSLIGKLRLR